MRAMTNIGEASVETLTHQDQGSKKVPDSGTASYSILRVYMREGSLDAPTRHPIAWQDADFYDADKLDAEMRRVFEICHGCRRCFNLCDSFPRLFTLIDE